jgi:hypothetical protein
MRVGLPTRETSWAAGCRGDVDPALAQPLLDIAVAQRDARGEPDAMAEDLAGETAVLGACGDSGWRHVGLPIGVFAGFVRGHHWRESLTGQA